MDKNKRKRLEEKGWISTSIEELLGLSPEELAFIDFKLELSRFLKQRRNESNLTQVELAKKIGSSQSRVAKMEKGDPSVSTDLLIKSLFALNTSQKDIAQMLSV